MKLVIWTGLLTTAAILNWQPNLLASGIIGLEIFLLLLFLHRLGQKFVFLEWLALLATTQWLVFPLIGYTIRGVMAVPYEDYFIYAVPATLAFVLLVTTPLWSSNLWDRYIQDTVQRLTEKYTGKQNMAIALFIAGAFFWIFQVYVPISLSLLFFMLAHLLLLSICLFIFIPYRYKWIWFGSGLLLIIATTLLNGMIGTVILWIFSVTVVYTTRYPIRMVLPLKFLFFGVAVWMIAVLQMSKTQYRKETWDIRQSEFSARQTREINQDPELFLSLVRKNAVEFDQLFKQANLVQMAYRLNQGMLVTYCMDYVPKRRSFGNGEVTIKNTLVAFIPRILWPDKPIVGQQEYFKAYTGIRLTKFTSSTLGPIGDAYADFGRYGFVFLALFGFLISSLYKWFIRASRRTPFYLLWFMILYLGTLLVSEISVASYINGVFKLLLFIYGMRLLLKYVFKWDL